MSAKPPLPPRKQGLSGPPKLPAKPPVVPLSTKPTQTFKPVSSGKPVLPARVPLHQNGPALPSRNKTTIGAGEQKSCGRQKSTKYESRDFSIVDDYVRSLPEYTSPHELSAALTCNFTDVVDKYRAVFCWLAFNVAYDADALLQNRVPPQSAENTFRNKLAVCAGYSMLFQKLCDASQLHCIEVSGYAKGFGFDPAKPPAKGSNHAWNAVFVENEWRLIDATWGAGTLNGTHFAFGFNDFFFLTDPEEFIYQHMPMKDEQQFTSSRFTWEQFFSLNNLNGKFWKSGVQLLNHIDCASVLRPAQGQELQINLLVPKECLLMAALDSDTEKHSSLVQMQPSQRAGFWQATCTFRVMSAGSMNLTIFSKSVQDHSSKEYGDLLRFAVVASPSTLRQQVPKFPVTYGWDHTFNIKAPLISPLPLGTVQNFVIQDISEHALTTHRALAIWQPSAPEFKRRVSGREVLYELSYTISVRGDLTLGESVREGPERGTSHGIACWEV